MITPLGEMAEEARVMAAIAAAAKVTGTLAMTDATMAHRQTCEFKNMKPLSENKGGKSDNNKQGRSKTRPN